MTWDRKLLVVSAVCVAVDLSAPRVAQWYRGTPEEQEAINNIDCILSSDNLSTIQFNLPNGFNVTLEPCGGGSGPEWHTLKAGYGDFVFESLYWNFRQNRARFLDTLWIKDGDGAYRRFDGDAIPHKDEMQKQWEFLLKSAANAKRNYIDRLIKKPHYETMSPVPIN